MITAYKIARLAHLPTEQLERAVRKNYPEDSFISSKFLGITNGGQFCYEVMYFDVDEEGNAYTKVFVDLNESEEPVAEY